MSSGARSSMAVDLRVGERLVLGGDVRIRLERKSGSSVARLVIDAPRTVKIFREAESSSAHPTSDDVRTRSDGSMQRAQECPLVSNC